MKNVLIEKYKTLMLLSNSSRDIRSIERKMNHKQYIIDEIYGVGNYGTPNLMVYAYCRENENAKPEFRFCQLNKFSDEDIKFQLEINSTYIFLTKLIDEVKTELHTEFVGKTIYEKENPEIALTVKDLYFSDDFGFIVEITKGNVYYIPYERFYD